jgi:acyl dehydratase
MREKERDETMTLEEIRQRYPNHGIAKPIHRGYDDELFEIQYPGRYPPERQEALLRRIEEDEALISRGPVNTEYIKNDQIPENYPGYFGKSVVKEDFARYIIGRYDPDNRVYTDEAYARSLGYEGLPVYFTYAMFYLIQTVPPETKDIYTPCNISHTVTSHRPVYVGDTIYGFRDRQYSRDITPEDGSIYRTIAITTEGSAYNQRGELVATFVYHILEHTRIFKDAAYRQGLEGPYTKGWDAPNWWKRPRHYYTDEDWDFIRSVWQRETKRGAEPLYWEDVKVGDMPAWTLDGPVDDGGGDGTDAEPNGLGFGGTRTLKKEILDPDIFKTMVRNPVDGIYRFPRWNDSYPEPPAWINALFQNRLCMPNDDPLSEPEPRYHFINIFGRDLHFRHLYNWAGDHVKIRKLSWSIMSPESLAECGMPGLPEHPDYVRYHKLAPMGRPVTAHGLEGDIALMKSYVQDKYIEDGKGCVRLIWWIEDIEGNVWQEGDSVVELPMRGET